MNYFSIVARCYSIGLIGIVLLLSLYKKQLEKPLLYSLLLVFTANTSFLNTVAIIPLGFIFIHNLCNKASIIPKKQYIFSWVILASGATLWIFPFLNGYGYRELLGLHYPSIHHIFNFFKGKNLFFVSYLIVLTINLLLADKKAKFSILLTLFIYLLVCYVKCRLTKS